MFPAWSSDVPWPNQHCHCASDYCQCHAILRYRDGRMCRVDFPQNLRQVTYTQQNQDEFVFWARQRRWIINCHHSSLQQAAQNVLLTLGPVSPRGRQWDRQTDSKAKSYCASFKLPGLKLLNGKRLIEWTTVFRKDRFVVSMHNNLSIQCNSTKTQPYGFFSVI